MRREGLFEQYRDIRKLQLPREEVPNSSFVRGRERCGVCPTLQAGLERQILLSWKRG